MLDATHNSQVDVQTEFGVVSLILIVWLILASIKMIFSILQVSGDGERLLTASVRHFTLYGIH